MNPPAPGMPGTLFVVATPIGNLEDVTLRALRTLREASVVAAEDTRRTGQLLGHYDIRTPLASLHDHNEHARAPELIRRLLAGESVALVSDAGTPLVSDPGFRRVRDAAAAGIPVVAVPGPSALTAALSVAGLPVDGFTFAGFPPARSSERRRWLEGLAGTPRTLVFFEAPHRAADTLRAVLDVLGDRWVVLARELTKLHEDTRRGWLSDLLAGGVDDRGEFVFLVSDLIRPAAAGEERPRAALSDAELAARFGDLTKNGDLSRRDAADVLAKETATSRQEVYRRLKSSGVLR
jgi:16S rRNA (cytidine1402-2'-O)-methyltransferase